MIILRREQKKRKIIKILKLGHEGFNFHFTGFVFVLQDFISQVVIALNREKQVDGEIETRPFASAALTLQS